MNLKPSNILSNNMILKFQVMNCIIIIFEVKINCLKERFIYMSPKYRE